jgi:hypothetical protein
MSPSITPASARNYFTKRRVYGGVVFAAALLLALLNWRAYSPGDSETLLSQLRYLGRSLDGGSGERMQSIFPEGYVFAWALYGLASAQVAEQLPTDDARRVELLDRTRTAVDRVDSSFARSTFPLELDPPRGAFYCAWSLYLRAQYIRAAGVADVSAEFLETFDSDCAEFADAIDRSLTPFLPSYKRRCWPADTCVGIAALAIRDRLLGPKYESTIQRWLENARKRLDPNLNALSHAADPVTGAPLGGVRGSSLALMCRVLVDASPEFAEEQYVVLRTHFVNYHCGVPGVREYPKGSAGDGDVDSGPIILTFSGPAIVVGAGAARVHGDESLVQALLGTVEVAGLPIEWNGSRRYLLGAVPVGDAFIAWARSSEPLPAAESSHWERIIPTWWAFPAHTVSVAVLVVMVFRLRYFERTSESTDPPQPQGIASQ